MAVCKPVYSSGSTNPSTVPDFESFLEENPTNFFNRQELTTLNSLNNVLLSNVELSDYPNLQNRINQGFITDEEFADFIIDSGYDINSIKQAFVNNFPVPIDYDTFSALFESETNVSNPNSVVNNDDPIELLNSFSTTGTTGGTSGTTTGTTGGTGTTTGTTGGTSGAQNDFILDTGSEISRNPDNTPVEVERPDSVQNPNWDASQEIRDILTLQNKYFDPLVFNQSTCSILSNPFAKVLGALSSLQDLSSSLSDAFSFLRGIVSDVLSYGDLSGIISALMSKLNQFVSDLKNQVTSIANQALSQVTAIANKVDSFFRDAIYLPKHVFNYVKKKIEQTKGFFKPENIKGLQDKIQSFFDQMKDQFEDKLPNALNYFLLIGCGLSNLLQQILNAPVEKLNTTVSSMTYTHDIMSGYSSTARNSAVEAGAIRTTPRERTEQSRQGVSNNNSSSQNRSSGVQDSGQWDVPSGYVKEDITEEELSSLDQMSFSGFPGALSFTSGVNTMGKRSTEKYKSLNDPQDLQKTFPKTGHTYYGDIFDAERNFYDEETRDDSGWKMIVKKNPGHWVRLIRVAQRLQQQGYLSGTLQVNSAYRSPFYNYFMVGGAEYSNHMEGKAFDVSHTNLNDEGEAAFIRACSEEGFTRIVKYNTFYHIDDDGPRSTYWKSKSLLGKQARAAHDAHVRGVYQRS